MFKSWEEFKNTPMSDHIKRYSKSNPDFTKPSEIISMLISSGAEHTTNEEFEDRYEWELETKSGVIDFCLESSFHKGTQTKEGLNDLLSFFSSIWDDAGVLEMEEDEEELNILINNFESKLKKYNMKIITPSGPKSSK